MLGLKGDFLGFTFNGVHSSDLGITHVSEGDRYKEGLIPEIEDKTVEIPGLDGAYFYGSNFKTRSISLSIAFDEVTEEQIRKMRQVFGYKHTGELIFDELPYKKYLVKVASPPELEYVCFDERAKTPSETSIDGVRVEDREEVIVEDTYEEEITIRPGEIESYSIEGAPESITVTSNGSAVPDTLWDYEDGILNTYGVDIEEDIVAIIAYTLSHIEQRIKRQKVYPWIYSEGTQRIYKGEGSIEFIAYYPFAKQVAKERSAFEGLGYTNIDEWWNSSGLLSSYEGIDTYSYDGNVGIITVYNPGDMDTGFRLVIPFENNIIPTFTLTYKNKVLNIAEVQRKEEDLGIQINTINGLIEGVQWDTNLSDINDSLITSGQIYNEYATGEFFKIEPDDENQQINISADLGDNVKIYYDYLYF